MDSVLIRERISVGNQKKVASMAAMFAKIVIVAVLGGLLMAMIVPTRVRLRSRLLELQDGLFLAHLFFLNAVFLLLWLPFDADLVTASFTGVAWRGAINLSVGVIAVEVFDRWCSALNTKRFEPAKEWADANDGITNIEG